MIVGLASISARSSDVRAADVGCSVASLKQAIIDTNNSAGPDTLSLAENCTYTLTTVDNTEFDGDNGLPIITDELVIEGNGATIQRAAGDEIPKFRILRATQSHLTIRDITITRGSVATGDSARGGGVRTSGALTIEDSLINLNSVSGPISAQGGGTFASTTTTVRNSTILGNSAVTATGLAGGGGSFSFQHLVVEGSVYSTNSTSSTATGTGTAVGGGAATEGSITVSDTVFTSNNATAHNASGGGLMSQGNIIIEASRVQLNSATSATNIAHGGGVNAQGDLTVQTTTINNNVADGGVGSQGGGTYSFDDSSIERSLYRDNTATTASGAAEGGGAYAIGALSAKNSTIAFNTAVGDPVLPSASAGGGTFSAGLSNIRNVTYHRNLVLGNGGSGRALYAFSGAEIHNSIISGTSSGLCDASNVTDIDADFHNLATHPCDNATVGVPDLQPLAENGGPTPTYALGGASDAIDLGLNCEPTDQRGLLRPIGVCDAGAFEDGAAGGLPYDVDCDGNETLDDALAVMNVLAGFQVGLLPGDPCDADVDDNTTVNIADVILLRQYHAGLLIN